MSLLIRTAAGAAAAAALFAGAPSFAAADPFAEACAARPGAVAAHCACQSKLAHASLNGSEQKIAIRAMRGDAEGFRADLAAMGDKRREAFVAKMRALEARTRTECR